MKGSDGATGYEPNFEFRSRGMVREENWAEYQSSGFTVLWDSVERDDRSGRLAAAKFSYGDDNVLAGDAYDYDAGRPLRHKPGMGIYLGPDGVAYREARRAKEATREQSPGQPAES